MKADHRFDLAIIGAGAGGLSVAAVAANLGLKVAIIEKNKMGGDCLNAGCIPSKSFLAAAKAAHQFSQSADFGIKPQSPIIDFEKIMQHVRHVIDQIAPHDSVERFTNLGAKVFLAPATFIDKNTIKAGAQLIKAKRIIIATGSSPFIPNIPGLDRCHYHTNETIFGLTKLPRHLIVIGGGPIGCELAQGFAFLGSSVTLLEAFNIMPKDDPELVSKLRAKLIAAGITIHENCHINSVNESDGQIQVSFNMNHQNQSIKGSHLLVATGRKANIDTLNLEIADVKHTSKSIVVDKHQRTSNKKIYAIGDVVGPYQFTHMANYQAGIVIQHAIFKLPVNAQYHAVPWVTYTSPPLAQVGLIHSEATKLYPNARCLELSFDHNDRAQTELTTNGKIKVSILPNGKVIGSSILADHADELILPWIILIKNNLSLKHLTSITIPYPTLNEISKRIASEFYSQKLYSKPVRFLVKLLNYF